MKQVIEYKHISLVSSQETFFFFLFSNSDANVFDQLLSHIYPHSLKLMDRDPSHLCLWLYLHEI